MVNVIPPDYVDEVPVVEPNQHDDVPVVPEPVFMDEHEDPEEEDPQEEEDDMEIDIEEDENEPERLYGRETVHALVEKNGKEKEKFYGKLILEVGNEVRSSVEKGTTAMEKPVEKLSNTEEKVKCKKLKKELEEAMFINTFLRMQNKQVERDLYWTRV
uniref:Uncharacterized protein n=1 Tax=Tanacetum cinerariifolium TaxID=118510 RepID=A0A6L2J9B8_TANCI|nr:hypothetical protein [Tanacetum cinerariifolium]